MGNLTRRASQMIPMDQQGYQNFDQNVDDLFNDPYRDNSGTATMMSGGSGGTNFGKSMTSSRDRKFSK